MPPFAIENKHQRKWGQEAQTPRIAFGGDYDRVLYSTAFRRLGGVTQVVASSEIALFHNRLTHTLKTAQVGSRLTNHLREEYSAPKWKGVIEEYGGLDPRVVRAACMAHDLGHPPFGHIAEEELQVVTSARPNEVKRQRDNVVTARHPRVQTNYALPDGFEGNAQSLRIVTKLAFREPTEDNRICRALDLTRGVLAAMLKYPWGFGVNDRPAGILPYSEFRKWGYYNSERQIVRWVFENQEFPPGRATGLRGREVEYRTIEAQVMDWADDISYAIHDVEDFFRAGIIPLDLLAVSDGEWEKFFEYAWNRSVARFFQEGEKDQVGRWAQDVRSRYFPRTPYVGSRRDREDLHYFAAELIRSATNATTLDENGVVLRDREDLAKIEVLKNLTWYYVIDRPSLESLQRGQRALVRSLFRNLIGWVEESWRGPRLGEPTGSTPRELPARLIEFLEIAFSPDPITGCQGYSDQERICRAVVDYIVSLTETQAVELNTRLVGGTIHSVLEGWFGV